MSLTPDQQIYYLVRMGSEKPLNWLCFLLTVLSAALLTGGIITWHPVYFIGAVLVSIITMSAWQSAPHIRNAVTGFAEGRRRQGEISIDITQWSDSESYHVTVMSGCRLPWNFEFIPQGWKPVECTVDAELFFIAEVEWPVLLITGKGIIYPRYTPKIADGFVR